MNLHFGLPDHQINAIMGIKDSRFDKPSPPPVRRKQRNNIEAKIKRVERAIRIMGAPMSVDALGRFLHTTPRTVQGWIWEAVCQERLVVSKIKGGKNRKYYGLSDKNAGRYR